jgi:hypothetical protein
MDLQRDEHYGSSHPSPCAAETPADTQISVGELDFQRDVIKNWLGRAGLLHVEPLRRRTGTDDRM